MLPVTCTPFCFHVYVNEVQRFTKLLHSNVVSNKYFSLSFEVWNGKGFLGGGGEEKMGGYEKI